MKRLVLLALLTACGILQASGQTAKIYAWDSRVEDGAAFALAPTRGETMVLHPRMLSYGSPMDLTHAYTVVMLYKAVGETNVYAIEGGVVNPTNGQIEVTWTSAHEHSAATYGWDILVSGASSTVVAARGLIKFRDGQATDAQLGTNTPIYIIDFAQAQLLNVGLAPFLSSYEIADVREFTESIQNGTGDIDAKDVTVRGSLNYTNWPSYLARTSQIPQRVHVSAGANITVAITTNAGVVVYTVTGAAGGGSGGGGIGSYTNTEINGVTHSNSVRIADGDNLTWALGTDGVWRASAAIPQSWASTGTLYWVVNGETIGRVDSNGITLLKGSLSLYDEDLTCNVRLYDGSRIAPSLTPQGHPGTWGLFFKSYLGTYSAAWSQGSNEVGVLHLGGITLTRTNSAFIGRVIGDLSESFGYPESLFTSWKTNAQLSAITVTNSGTITVKDAGGTTRFSVNGSSGATSIRGQDTDSRYAFAITNRSAFAWTNVLNGVTNVLYFNSQGICTNYTP